MLPCVVWIEKSSPDKLVVAIVVIAAVFTVPATCLLIPLMFEKIAGWSTTRGRAAMEKKFAPTPMREEV